MTLIVALKFQKGVLLASDTRVMLGVVLKRDHERKLELLTKNIGIAAAGLVGTIDDIISEVKTYCESRPVAFEDVLTYLSDKALEWFKKNKEKIEEEEEEIAVFVMVSSNRIRRIHEKGYSEEVNDYTCEGSGALYGEYILSNSFKEKLEENEAKELAIRVILETSKMDPNVGKEIEMMVCAEGKCEIIDKSEVEKLKALQLPLSKKVTEEQSKIIREIVKTRDEINNVFGEKFGFKLFQSNEMAVLQLMKPCRTDEEFTSNVSALALLIDQLNTKNMIKTGSKKDGSISIFEEFLDKNSIKVPPEIMSNFRDIVTLRSKKFPTHATDPKFVEVSIKLYGKYPPNLSDLYLKALELYKESLRKLLGAISPSEVT